MSKKLLTLCIVHQDERVLLGMKKRGFGAGRWNGFGGKVGKEESIEDAARRELREEAGIEARDIEKLDIIDFEFQGNPELLEVHIFKVNQFTGIPSEGEEMSPQWFQIADIPFQDMWPDDIYWLPLFLANKKLRGRFVFGPGDTIVDNDLKEVSSL